MTIRPSLARHSSGVLLSLCVLILSAVPAGCQVLPTIRGQSPEPEEPRQFEVADNATPASAVITDIVVEGNNTIASGAILAQIASQPGRPADENQIKQDVRALFRTHWFSNVERRYRLTDDGLVLVFRVTEKPIVRSVTFQGNKRVRDKTLLKQIGIEPGSPFDVVMNRSAARKIQRYYREKKSYPKAEVRLTSGGDTQDRDVSFEIEEGPHVVVSKVKFTGNHSFNSAVLRTKLKTKSAFLGGLTLFSGKYDESSIPDDIAALERYYKGLGYFDVEIEKDVAIFDNKWHIVPENKVIHPVDAKAVFTYHIKEGPQYHIRNIELTGNQIFTTEELSEKFKLGPGDFFSSRDLNKDIEGMREKYGKLGRLFATIDAVPRFLDDNPEMVDLVYQIDEDKEYELRRINVHILAPGGNPHTRETVVLNTMLIAPGDPADPHLIDLSRTRLGGSVFERAGPLAPRVEISRVKHEEPSDFVARGQNPLDAQPEPFNPLVDGTTAGDPYGGLSGPYSRAISRPGQADLDIFVNEAQTGRLMFGVGVNSNAGVLGTFILEENNFDITRWPTGWRDFADGTAFRGNGERFRIEAVPGERFSRYRVSWQSPYFLDTDYSLGVSGFYYQRFVPGWDEERTGGRITVGKQIDKWLSVAAAFRLEDVELKNPAAIPQATPPLLRQALGNNFLSTVRLAVSHDTRDSSFMPSSGHFLEGAFEQGFGDFVYPRFEATASQHITTWERVDGGGRHILTLFGQAGWTGEDTPIFERYFAGGYQSFRGFGWRGLGPHQAGNTDGLQPFPDGAFIDGPASQNLIRVGGQTMAIGSVEYAIPLTADEMIRVVGFTDFGTVDATSKLSSFRLTAGFGFRLNIRAMGPAPLAFDFGFPLISDEGDDEQIFTFSLALAR